MDYWITDMSGEKIEISQEQVNALEKDLCYLLHLIVNDYRNMGGNWDWDWYSPSLFSMKYWEFLGISGCETVRQQNFINNGCLLWVLGLSMEHIEDFDTWNIDHYGDEIAVHLSTFVPEDEDTARILHITQYFLDVARSLPVRTGFGRPRDTVQLDDQMLHELDWAFDKVVKGYYWSMRSLIEGKDSI